MSAVQPTFLAEGDIAPARFIKPGSGDFSALQAGANEATLGISMEGAREAPIPSVSTNLAAQSGDSFHSYGEGEDCLLELGGTVAAGARLKSDANGKGVAAATTGTTAQESGAVAYEGGVAGDLIRVRVEREVYRPAVS